MRLPILIVLAACSGKSSDPPPDPKPSPTPAPAPAKPPGDDPWSGSAEVAPPEPATALVLESPGAEPRAVLSYARPAYKRTFMFRDRMSLEGKPGLDVELTVAWACKAGGACTYQLERFEMPGAPPDPAIETVQQSTRGEATIGADGTMLVQPTTFMKTTPSLTELLKLAVVQVPTEPVGTAAIWHVDDGEAKRRYELSSVRATGFSIAVDITHASGDTIRGTLSFERGEPIAQTVELVQKSTTPVTSEMVVTIQPPRE